MSALTVSEFIATCRELVSDTGTGHASTIRDEKPNGDYNGVSVRYKLAYYPVALVGAVPDVELRKDGTLLSQGSGAAKYTVDSDNGILTLGTAPVAGPPRTLLEATYRFLWFADADYYEFIAHAYRLCFGSAISGGTASARATAVLASVSDSFLDALAEFVSYCFNSRRAEEYAHRFASSSGGTSIQIDVVTKNFRDLATAAFTRGIQMRNEVYERRGQRAAPAAKMGGFTDIRNNTSRR